MKIGDRVKIAPEALAAYPYLDPKWLEWVGNIVAVTETRKRTLASVDFGYRHDRDGAETHRRQLWPIGSLLLA